MKSDVDVEFLILVGIFFVVFCVLLFLAFQLIPVLLVAIGWLFQ